MTQPILDRVRATPWLIETPLDDQTLGDVLDAQLRFSVTGSGRYSERALVPQNEAARRALESRRLEQRLHGLIGVVDPVTAITEIESISLSTSPAGAAANALLSDIARGRTPMPAPDSSPAERRAVLDTLGQWTSFFGEDSSSLASYGPSDVVVGPALTSVLTGQRSDPHTARDAVQVFVHEMQHRVSPVPDAIPDDRKTLSLWSYLEEGTADALATMPGVTAEAAQRAGIGVARGPMESPNYAAYVDSLDRLLDAAGLDRDKRQDHARIVDLLQGRPAPVLPPRLARAILDAHGIVEPTAADRLAKAITAIGTHGIEPRDESARERMHRHIADATQAAIQLVDDLDER